VEKGGKYGYINRSGKIVIPIDYDYAYDFSSGWAEVVKEGRSIYIDRTGKCVKFCK
jgi:transketolase C-terminal domain/subunit